MPKPTKKRQRVTSSCSVCRSRKTKCDKRRPVCSSCVKSNLQDSCVYEIPHWVHATVADDKPSIMTIGADHHEKSFNNAKPRFAANGSISLKQYQLPPALENSSPRPEKHLKLGGTKSTFEIVPKEEPSLVALQASNQVTSNPPSAPHCENSNPGSDALTHTPPTDAGFARYQSFYPTPMQQLSSVPSSVPSHQPANSFPHTQHPASSSLAPPQAPRSFQPHIAKSQAPMPLPAIAGQAPLSGQESNDASSELLYLQARIRHLENELSRKQDPDFHQNTTSERTSRNLNSNRFFGHQEVSGQKDGAFLYADTKSPNGGSQSDGIFSYYDNSQVVSPLGQSASSIGGEMFSKKSSTGTSLQLSTLTGNLPVIHESEYHNFSNSYFPYLFKKNSVLDCKALSHNALIARDKFLLNFFAKFVCDYAAVKNLVGSMMRNRQAKQEIANGANLTTVEMADEQREAIKGIITNISKKNEYATLIANMMKTSRTSQDYRLAFRHDIIALEFSEPTAQPMLSSILNNKFYPSDSIMVKGNELLIDMVLKMLPRIEIMRYLWKMYALYISPFIPIFNIKKITDEISEIFVGLELQQIFDSKDKDKKFTANDKEKIKQIKITSKLDYGRLSIFLTCLRLAYLAIKFNINDIAIRCPIEEEMMSIPFLLHNTTETIPADVITLSQMCLNFLKMTKKASYISVIASILLYQYTELREEGRVGFSLNQNHLALAAIINQAKYVGLNKDWKNEDILNFLKSMAPNRTSANHFHGDNEEIYNCRKLWYYLVNLDGSTAISNGKLLNISSEEEYDTKFPNLNEFKFDYPYIKMIPDYVKEVENKEESIVSVRIIEELSLKNMKFEYEVNKVFIQISKLFNNLRTPVKLSMVMQMILKVEQLLMMEELNEDKFIDYNLLVVNEPRSNKKRVTVGENYYKIVDFLQMLAMYYRLKLCCFILSFVMFLHYDQSKDSIHGVNNTLFFLKKSLISSFDIIKVSKEFLCNNEERLVIDSDFTKVEENTEKGKCYGFKNFNFIILPTIDTMCYRAIIVIETLLLRIAHCLSILDAMIKKMSTSTFLLVTISIEEYHRKKELFQDMYYKIYRFYYKLVKLLVEKFAKFYSHSFKETLMYQYYMVCFKSPHIISEWFKKRDVFFESSNNFINLSLKDITELKKIIDTLIKMDEEKYPDNISDDLFGKNFSQDVSTAKPEDNQPMNFGLSSHLVDMHERDAVKNAHYGPAPVPASYKNGGHYMPSGMAPTKDDSVAGDAKSKEINGGDLLNVGMDGTVASDFKNLIEEFFDEPKLNSGTSGNPRNSVYGNASDGIANDNGAAADGQSSGYRGAVNPGGVVDDAEFSFYNLNLNNYLPGNSQSLHSEGLADAAGSTKAQLPSAATPASPQEAAAAADAGGGSSTASAPYSYHHT